MISKNRSELSWQHPQISKSVKHINDKGLKSADDFIFN